MKGRLTIVPVDPTAPVSSKELAGVPRLEALKAGIGGGYIEVVPYFTRYRGERCVAFCDEDGKLHGLPVNRVATALWYAQLTEPLALRDYLVGPIVIVTGDRELLEEL
jgi:hypothetical protein